MCVCVSSLCSPGQINNIACTGKLRDSPDGLEGRVDTGGRLEVVGGGGATLLSRCGRSEDGRG